MASAGDEGHVSSWAADIKQYERERRHDVHPGLVAGAPANLDAAATARAERAFDPVTQRFRCAQREKAQQEFEDKERVVHLNRAQDVQLLRQHPTSIVNHGSVLEALSTAHNSGTSQKKPSLTLTMPSKVADYNIVSNLPSEVHHWAAPDDRPQPALEGEPRQRKVPAVLIKDFDIVTTRYKASHEEKAERDKQLLLLEAAVKHRSRNRFNPISQTLREPRQEANLRAWEDARVAATIFAAQQQKTPGLKLRPSELYDMVTLEEKESETLSLLDQAQASRKSRYRARHQIDAALRENGEHFEEMNTLSKLEQISYERFAETARRGYNIVTNHEFGTGHKRQQLRAPPHCKPPAPSPWELVQQDRTWLPGASVRAASTPRHLADTADSAPRSARRGTPFLQRSCVPAPEALPGSVTGSVFSQPLSAR
mmetsp:Transcript_2967/g.7572  ORF Transcript_2967/g.7572 Transcript_2967/m.7572 type:complete len:426 (+) Transcript_2967:61-1338(+)